MQVNWKGVYPAVSTQFHADESLNLSASQQMLGPPDQRRCERHHRLWHCR